MVCVQRAGQIWRRYRVASSPERIVFDTALATVHLVWEKHAGRIKVSGFIKWLSYSHQSGTVFETREGVLFSLMAAERVGWARRMPVPRTEPRTEANFVFD